MCFGINEKALNEINKIFANYSIEKKLIFGSRARGDYKYNSDIDIAIFGEISRREFIRLYGDLMESDCIYKIDLVHFEKVNNDELKRNILNEGIEF
jgi:hypothetical protein